MRDCSSEILKFHNNSVQLPESDRSRLRGHRDANQKRLKENLKKEKLPIPNKFVKQGSYAMRTQIQHPQNDFDIDDGAVFIKSELEGAQGADKTPLDARKMVCDAIQDESFKKKPEIKTNCVRVFYNEGYHVDIPVYRTEKIDSGKYELASVEWKESDPEGVTQWFSECLKNKPSGGGDSDHQMRRMIRLLKAFGASRPSWNYPSGFILTVLVYEVFSSDDRDDQCFHNLIVGAKNRLGLSRVVQHPVVNETITKTNDDPDMVLLKEKLEWAIERLEVIHQGDCTKKAALKAWKEVFGTDDFDDLIEEDSSGKSTFAIKKSSPTEPVDKRGGGRFG